MAADAEPIEIILHLPLLCEDKVLPTALSVSLLNRGLSELIVVAAAGRPSGYIPELPLL